MILDEIAEFFASLPNRDQLLKFRPSTQLQERAGQLLLKQNEGDLPSDERRELDQFAQAEALMRLVKAKLHARKPTRR